MARRDSRGRFVRGGSRVVRAARRAGGYVRRGARRVYGRVRGMVSGYRMGLLGKMGLATIVFGPLITVLGGWNAGDHGTIVDIFTWYGYAKKNKGSTGAAIAATLQELFDRFSIGWIGYKPSDGGTWDAQAGGGFAWRYALAGGVQLGADMLFAHVAKRAGRKLALPMVGQLLGSK